MRRERRATFGEKKRWTKWPTHPRQKNKTKQNTRTGGRASLFVVVTVIKEAVVKRSKRKREREQTGQGRGGRAVTAPPSV